MNLDPISLESEYFAGECFVRTNKSKDRIMELQLGGKFLKPLPPGDMRCIAMLKKPIDLGFFTRITAKLALGFISQIGPDVRQKPKTFFKNTL